MNEDIIELGPIGVREKDIMAQQGKARSLRLHGPGDGREGARLGGRHGDRAGDVGAKQARAERRKIAIHDDGVGRDTLAIGQLHPASAPALDKDARCAALIEEGCATALRHGGEPLGQPLHAALDQPDALALHMGHQHESGGRRIGRGAAIGGVAGEELAQARIGEGPRQGARQGRIGGEAHQLAPARQADPARQLQKVRPGSADVAVLERRIDALRPRGEIPIGLRIPRAGECRDGGDAFVEIGEEIKPRAIAPAMAGERVGGPAGDVIVKGQAHILRQLIEDPAHGEDRGAGIDGGAARHDFAHLAARTRSRFHDRDLDALRGQTQRGGQSAHARPYDHNMAHAHPVASARKMRGALLRVNIN